MFHKINQAIDQFEPTIRLLYRISVVLAIYFGMTYIGNSLYVDGPMQQDTTCEAPPRLSS